MGKLNVEASGRQGTNANLMKSFRVAMQVFQWKYVSRSVAQQTRRPLDVLGARHLSGNHQLWILKFLNLRVSSDLRIGARRLDGGHAKMIAAEHGKKKNPSATSIMKTSLAETLKFPTCATRLGAYTRRLTGSASW